MNWLVLSYFISLGTLGYNGQFLAPAVGATFDTPPGTFQTTLGLEAQMIENHLFIGGSVQTWQTSDGDRFFSPFESLYVFNAGLRWSGLEIGYRHECDHLTLANMSLPIQGFGAVKDEFYMSYRASVKVF